MKVGDIISWERTFTEDDIRLFNGVSGDQGVHHVPPDDQGRLMVHGLLTATVPTKIGGDMNFIAGNEVSIPSARVCRRHREVCGNGR